VPAVPAPSPAPAPVPDGWQQVTDRAYWYHKETRQSRWTKPDASIVAAQEARLAAEREATAERTERRKAQMAAQAATAQAEANEADGVRDDVQRRLAAWVGRGKKIHELLRTLHELLPGMLPAPLQVADGGAGAKRGYRDAVKIVHPDRLGGGLGVAERQLCEGAFTALTDAFNVLRASGE
jgi:hypothetical protein